MKVLISGSSGLVGASLCYYLHSMGYQICKLVRARANLLPNELAWDLERGVVNIGLLEGIDAVVHLAGENIASGRWTERKKKEIRDSRVRGTELLSHALASVKNPPKVFLCASAVGYYGNRADEVLTEESSQGTGFLAEVCEEWETATREAAQKGIRVVNMRFGAILSDKGGMLKQLLTPFSLGLGGKIGKGQQYMSWIDLNDVLKAIQFLIENPISGPVNVVSPNPVTNETFTKTLGRVLHRPTFLAMPESVARFAFGEMADEVLLTSERVKPGVLENQGFRFQFPYLESSLRSLLT